jgi:DnaJ like chaperone protein
MDIWRQLAETARRIFSGEADDALAEPERDVAFTIAVIGLGAKLAKADGKVTADEIQAFRRIFRVTPEAERHAQRVFDLAQQTTLGFESYARKLAKRWRSFPSLLEDVLDALFYVAAADGVISQEEIDYLERVAEIFGLSEGEFRRIKTSWLGADADDPYVILGVDHDISDADLKRAYRRIAAANHPDRCAARGSPGVCERLATQKMAVINAAYSRIRAERGLGAGR